MARRFHAIFTCLYRAHEHLSLQCHLPGNSDFLSDCYKSPHLWSPAMEGRETKISPFTSLSHLSIFPLLPLQSNEVNQPDSPIPSTKHLVEESSSSKAQKVKNLLDRELGTKCPWGCVPWLGKDLLLTLPAPSLGAHTPPTQGRLLS